jgi:hypothetical protein
VTAAGNKAGSVAVAYVHSQEVAHSWHLSMLELFAYDMGNNGRVWQGGWHAMRCATGGLPEARNAAVAGFLEGDSEWLFWIDTDMGFRPDTVDRLMAAADPVERPIVGALCFAQRQGVPDGYGGFVTAPASTIFDWLDIGGDKGFAGRTRYPANQVVRCAGTGSAAILIHRSVFEAIRAEHGPVWYDQAAIPKDGGKQLLSEDLSFCLRAGDPEPPDPRAHRGPDHALQELLASGSTTTGASWSPRPPPSRTAVIVPVLKRPQNAAPFMRPCARAPAWPRRTWWRTTTRRRPKAWDEAGATVLYGRAAHLVRREGQPGYAGRRPSRGCSSPATTSGSTRAGSTTPRRRRGRVPRGRHQRPRQPAGHLRRARHPHADPPLLRRRGRRLVGRPRRGVPRGLRHWFVDDEIVTAAKQRGVWAMALVVEGRAPAPELGQGRDRRRLRTGRVALAG